MVYQGDPDFETLESFIFHYGADYLMLNTGMKHKNGKYQFRHDIVNHPGAGLAVVVFSSSCSFMVRSIMSGVYYKMSENAEIIGNAMENPELIQ